VIDLKHFQKYSLDPKTFRAIVGGGTLLGDLTKRMHDSKNRAMAHGTVTTPSLCPSSSPPFNYALSGLPNAFHRFLEDSAPNPSTKQVLTTLECPQVGIGGHATIGGLGPTSRQWGTALDHIEEFEIVLADSSIKRASATQNPDIFWAVKGAGASFGVVTEFVVRTEPEPGEAVHFSYSFTVGTYASMGKTFKAWQKFVSNPALTRKFASEAIITQLGLIISGTYFGSKKEYDALEMDDKFPGHQQAKTVVFRDWLGLVAHWWEEAALLLGGGVSAPLYTKTITFNGCDLIPDSVIDSLFDYLDKVKKGTLIWFIIASSPSFLLSGI
jgi:FAD/FMN-containing dehydrogenase